MRTIHDSCDLPAQVAGVWISSLMEEDAGGVWRARFVREPEQFHRECGTMNMGEYSLRITVNAHLNEDWTHVVTSDQCARKMKFEAVKSGEDEAEGINMYIRREAQRQMQPSDNNDSKGQSNSRSKSALLSVTRRFEPSWST